MNESGYRVPPKGEPSCGFDSEHCKLSLEFIFGILTVIAMTFMVFWFGFRHYQYEQKLARLLWNVNFKDIQGLVDDENLEHSPRNYNERVTKSTKVHIG